MNDETLDEVAPGDNFDRSERQLVKDGRALIRRYWPAPIEWSGGDVSLRLDALPA